MRSISVIAGNIKMNNSSAVRNFIINSIFGLNRTPETIRRNVPNAVNEVQYHCIPDMPT